MLNVSQVTAPRNAVPPQSEFPLARPDAKAEERKRLEFWLNEKISAGQKATFSEVVTLSPALAELLLERNRANRPISEVGLDRIKRDIVAGRWAFNGETIIVAHDGSLNDGQHRVRAVMETGKSIRMVIVFGVDRETRMTLDQGTGRTVGHYLSMHGFSDATALSAVANFVLMHREHGRLSSNPSERPTKSHTLQFAEHYKDLPDSLKAISKRGASSLASRPMLAFCHFEMSRIAGHSAATDFFDQLIKGASLEPGNPILHCRNRLVEMKSSQRIGDRAELIFRCWNAWRRKENINFVRITGKKLPKLER